jgi:hypothetical protein
MEMIHAINGQWKMISSTCRWVEMTQDVYGQLKMIYGIHGWLDMINKFQNDPHHDGLFWLCYKKYSSDQNWFVLFMRDWKWYSSWLNMIHTIHGRLKMICVIQGWLKMTCANFFKKFSYMTKLIFGPSMGS